MRRKWRFRRPSAPLVISILALFVALGGVGAVASGVLTTKKVKKIAKQQVLRLAPGLSVANAKTIDGVGLGSLTVGRSANNTGGCDLNMNSSTFTNCGSVDLTLPRSGRVFVDMIGTWRDGSGAAPDNGTCRITVDGTAVAGTDVRYGQATLTFNNVPLRASLTTNTVTGVLGAGTHTFGLQCNDPNGLISFSDTQMTAVMLGTD